MISPLIFAFIKSVGTTSTGVIERNIIPHGFTKKQVDFGIRCLYLLGLINIVEVVTLDGRKQYMFS